MNFNWKNILFFIFLLVMIYCISASIEMNNMTIEDYYLRHFDRTQTEVLFKFLFVPIMAFLIDFSGNNTKKRYGRENNS